MSVYKILEKEEQQTRKNKVVGERVWMQRTKSVKKRLCGLLLAVALVLSQSFGFLGYTPMGAVTTVSAETLSDGSTFTEGNIHYQVLSEADKTVCVTGCDIEKLSGDVYVGVNTDSESCTVNGGYTINKVNDYAFKDATKISTITFGNSITSFGTGVLDGCSDSIAVTNCSETPLSLPEKLGYLWESQYNSSGNNKVYVKSVVDPDSVIPSYVGTITATYYRNDGTSASTIKTYTKYTVIPKPEDPERAGYTFGGWYFSDTKQTNSNKYDFTKTRSKNLVLYARWIPNVEAVELTDGYSQQATFSRGESAWYKYTPQTTNTFIFKVANGAHYSVWSYFHGTTFDETATAETSISGPDTIEKELTAGNTYYYRVYVNPSQTSADNQTATISFNMQSTATEKKNVSGLTIELSTNSYVYDGTAKTPDVVVKDGTTTLTKGTDYTLSYSNNVNAGSGTLTVTGTGNYTGSVDKTFTINRADITSRPPSTMTVEGTVTKLGDISLSDYPDWSWSDASIVLTPGTTLSATAKYKDTRNYNNATQTVQITCEAKDIRTCNVTGLSDSYTYTGSEIKPNITVVDGSTTLTKDTDYIIEYSNNTYVGTATVTITGKGSYTNSISKNFTITQADLPANPPADTMDVEYDTTTTKVSQVSLSAYPFWQWQSAYENTALVEGKAVTAVAEYTGTDKSNYKSTTVTVSITKKENPLKPVTGFTHNTPDNISMIVGENRTIKITSVLPENHVDYLVSWSSTNTSAATIVQSDKDSAVLTAAASGETTINIDVNGIKKTIIVTVTNPVKSAVLSNTTLSLKGQETAALSIASTNPVNPDPYSIEWKSDNTEVATVDSTGVVTGLASGTANITAVINEAVTTAACKVTVTNPISSFTLSDTSVIVTNTKNVQIKTVSPENPDAYDIEWISDNPGIATVTKISDKAATITAVSVGNTTVTAKVVGTEIQQKITVTVNEATETLTGIVMEPTMLSLKKGETSALSVSPTPENAKTGTITYTSSAPDFASVDSTSGLVTAVKSGTATITATAGSFSAQCQVTVTNPVNSLTLDKNSMNLLVGGTEQFTYSVMPTDADDYSIECSSSDPSVATVEKKTAGMATVTARKAGSTTIKVEVKDGNGKIIQSRTCEVTVAKVILTGIMVSPTTMDLSKGGENRQIIVSAIPSTAELENVTYQSNDTGVATVSANGTVTPVAAGTTTIEVTSGNCKESVQITVTDPNIITGFNLNPETLNLEIGKTGTIQVENVTPNTATSYTVEWSSKNSYVATVSGNGTNATITAKTKGTAIITAKIDGIERTCSVKVTEEKPELTGIEVTPATMELQIGGESGQIRVVAVPEEAEFGTVTYSSADDTIAAVSTDGKVTPVGVGSTTITVTAGGYTKSVTVNIAAPNDVEVTGFNINLSALSLKTGETAVLQITDVTPVSATYDKVTWSSNNPNTAAVDANGKVTAIAGGTATIKAVINGIERTCNVTVTELNLNPGNEEDPTPAAIAIMSIKITGETKKVAPGKKITLKAVVSPENATNQQVTWKVSNSKYASVSSKGVVTTKKAGKGKSVTVTAVSVSDNSIKAAYKISIMKSAVTKIKLSGKTTLKKGKSTTIKAKFTPSKNISKELTWSSSNKKIATVSSKGKVTAKKKGKVKITAKAKDGSGKKAIITIQVK